MKRSFWLQYKVGPSFGMLF